MTDKYPHKEIGERLRWLREYLEYKDQKEFYIAHGFNQSRYSNWERGERRIPIEASEILFSRYDISLDFIYFGKTGNLSRRCSFWAGGRRP